VVEVAGVLLVSGRIDHLEGLFILGGFPGRPCWNSHSHSIRRAGRARRPRVIYGGHGPPYQLRGYRDAELTQSIAQPHELMKKRNMEPTSRCGFTSDLPFPVGPASLPVTPRKEATARMTGAEAGPTKT